MAKNDKIWDRTPCCSCGCKKTVGEVYAELDAKRRELDSLIFSLVGVNQRCGGTESMDKETVSKIYKKLREVQDAEGEAVIEILEGRCR